MEFGSRALPTFRQNHFIRSEPVTEIFDSQIRSFQMNFHYLHFFSFILDLSLLD